MKRTRRLLRIGVLISLPFILVAALVFMFFWLISSLGEAGCSWELTAHTWEDVNSNGIQDSGEPPLENIAITHTETRGWTTGSIPEVGGTDVIGQAAVLTPVFGHNCPDRVQVKAIAPEGYVPTTPDQISVTDKSTTSITFGFRRLPGFKPPALATAAALCRKAPFRHAGWEITGAVLRPNGDLWLASHGQSSGGVTLKRDGTDYAQDIDGFGPYASDIAAAPDGTIWAAGGPKTGVARFDGTSWKTYTTANSGLPANDAAGVEVTRDGQVWASTSAGIAEFDPVSERWHSYSDVGSGFSQLAYANDAMWLLSSTDDVMWIVDWDGLLTSFQTRSPRDTVRRIPVKLESVSYVKIWKPAIARDGSIWLIGEADRWPIVLHYNPSADRWTNYTYFSTRGSIPLDSFKSVGILSDGTVLIGGLKWNAIRLRPRDDPPSAEWLIYPTLVQDPPEDFISGFTVLDNGDVLFSYFTQGDFRTCKFPP